MDTDVEELLVGPGAGGGTIRVGGTVRRTAQRAPETMLLVLRHLEDVGFDAAPKVLGKDDEGRWILSFLPGEIAIAPYPSWASSDTLLASVASLLRRYHDAVLTMRVPSGLSWPTVPPAAFRGSVVGHMDVSMANVVCREGVAAALIDFEEVGLVDAVWDVARTVRHWVPLLDPADIPPDLEALADRQVSRLATFADRYQMSRRDRLRLIDAALHNADATYERMRQGAAAGHPGYLREWTGHAAARNRRGRRWIEARRADLQRAVAR